MKVHQAFCLRYCTGHFIEQTEQHVDAHFLVDLINSDHLFSYVLNVRSMLYLLLQYFFSPIIYLFSNHLFNCTFFPLIHVIYIYLFTNHMPNRT